MPLAPPATASGPPVVALVGATASGKSSVARDVAAWVAGPGRFGTDRPGAPPPLPVELVSVDSMAVYRGMDIGTAKPTPEEQAAHRYHLIDLVDAGEEFTVLQFQTAGRAALSGIAGRHHGALLVGGTGLYLRSLVDSLTFPGRYPENSVLSRTGAGRRRARGEHRTGPGPAGAPRPPRQARPGGCRPYRPVQPPTAGPGPGGHHGGGAPVLDLRSGARTLSADSGLVGRDPTPPVELDRRIAERFDRLMELGFLEEVRSLAARPGGLSRTARQALGYRELLTHLEEGVPLPDAVDQAVRRTRAFARRQMAWFRRDPRIVWLERDTDPVATIAALFREIPRDGAGMGDCPTAP